MHPTSAVCNPALQDSSVCSSSIGSPVSKPKPAIRHPPADLQPASTLETIIGLFALILALAAVVVAIIQVHQARIARHQRRQPEPELGQTDIELPNTANYVPDTDTVGSSNGDINIAPSALNIEIINNRSAASP